MESYILLLLMLQKILEYFQLVISYNIENGFLLRRQRKKLPKHEQKINQVLNEACIESVNLSNN